MLRGRVPEHNNWRHVVKRRADNGPQLQDEEESNLKDHSVASEDEEDLMDVMDGRKMGSDRDN